MSLIGATLWILGVPLYHAALYVANPADPAWARFVPADGVTLLGAAASLALYLYLRNGDRDPVFVMDLALVYMVATAFDIGVLMHWGAGPGHLTECRRCSPGSAR
jgi:hypothetical protein